MAGLPTPWAPVEFGRFRLVHHRRELLADGRPVELGARAFDMLVALIEAGGTVLSKDDLMRRVWPGQIVEENNLQKQISALRKAFGADRGLIRTVAGRGYQFTGETRATAEAGIGPSSARPTNLPEATSELVGREVEVRQFSDLLTTHRLVTLVGTGGIGKTRLSLAVARELLSRFPDGVFVAGLGALSSAESVPASVATALGLTLAGSVSSEGIAAAVGRKQLLVLLDNCEHVIEAAASIAETLLRASPGVSLLATSREPLRVDGEYVHRVPPLDVPAEDNDDPDEVSRYGAVRLFVLRASAAGADLASNRRLAARIAAICRRLDGIPLAIELAAARVPAFGVEGVAAGLDDRFRLLTGGNRAAPRRHQTLRATLDWSYELLTGFERDVLRRLAIFAGAFTLEAAKAVGAAADLPAADVVTCVGNLVGKSLLSADVASASTHYQLLETTRVYARDKLGESGELDRCSRAHAQYCRELFERAEAEWQTQSTAGWLATYGPQIDNLRTALEWAFTPGGDAELGVGLVIAAVPLWVTLSLLDELRARVEQALTTLESGARPDSRRRMQLHAAAGWWLVYTRGSAEETEAAWATALELAERLDDTGYRLHALWGLWASAVTNAKFGEALTLAQRFAELANQAGPADAPIGDRMVGASLHYLGDQSGAHRHLTRPRADIRAVRPDHHGTMRVPLPSAAPWLWWPRATTGASPSATPALARALWLRGCADQAMRTIERIVDEALAIHHTLSLCNVLAQAACPVALYAGDLAAAERLTGMLLDHTSRHGLDVFRAYGRCFRSILLIKQGNVEVGVEALRDAVDNLRRDGTWPQFHTAFLGALAEGYAAAGRAHQGLTTIDEALERSERTQERWVTAELLRIKGELLVLHDEPKAAEEQLGQALDWARRQDALAWELRGATSLARLWHRQRRTAEARKLLESVYARFTEGFDTADLVIAKALLDALR